MSYQVLARKYRPQRFADVVGQEHVTQTLTNAINQGRIAHAYLFCGPRGTGKTTIARIFAKCLNCTGGPKVAFDDDDPRCIEITEGRAIDVLEIDGASNNSVDQVRDLRETVKYAPAASRFKIYIIDEVHMLTPAAFNALLKTLEEPPAHVKFMFATTDPEKVLPTILSRCQRFDLRRIPAALIVKHLARIAKAEKVHVENAALYAVARGADGAMRDAESTLDQLINFCGSKIVETDVLSMFGLAAQEQLLALAGAACKGDVETALHQLDQIARSGKDLGKLLSDLLNHFRNLLVYQVSGGDLGLLEVSENEAATLKDQASLTSAETTGRILESLADAEMRMRAAVSKRILFEVTLLKAARARNAVSIDSLLEKLHALRKDAGSDATPRAAPAVLNTHGGQAAPARGPDRPTRRSAPVELTSENDRTPDPSPAPAIICQETETVAEPDLGALWSGLLDAVGRASPFTRSYLVKGAPISFADNALVIGFEPDCAEYLPLIDVPRNHALLKTKLKELGFASGQVKFKRVEAGSLPRAAAPAPSEKPTGTEPGKLDPAEFKNDPLVKQALEVFKGTIADVRG